MAGGVFIQTAGSETTCEVEEKATIVVPGSHPKQAWQAVVEVATTTRHTTEIVVDGVSLRSHRTHRASTETGCVNHQGQPLGANVWRNNPNCNPARPLVAAELGPTVTITAPVNGAKFAAGDEATFTGTASDAGGDSLDASIAWSYLDPSAPDTPVPLGAGATVTTLDIPAGT